MSMVQHLIKQRSLVSTRSSQLSPSIQEDISPSSSSITIGPTAILIIIVLAFLILMFCILHLLIRHLMKHQTPTSSQSNNFDSYPEMSDSDDLQRQLQELFQLHDSGLEQYLIDKLPVFQYKEILGLKDPFDCAVCLSEFSEKDKLRLLPLCSHAFHINCIDTWLVSNSTCPLCRSTILSPEISIENTMYDVDDTRTDSKSPGNGEIKLPSIQKTAEKKGVLRPVRLGKFRRLNGEAGDDNGAGETSSSRLNARRCYSMGSYQYVVGDADLRVALSRKDSSFNARKTTMVEHNENASSVVGEVEGKKISTASRADSYSVSKIWLWSKRGKPESNAETSFPSSSLNMDLPSWIGRRDLKIVCD